MPDILLPIIALLSGFALLIWSADEFTENGAKIANIFKVSPLIIGLLIFGFGTSAPEMLVSGLAAMDGNTGLSIGNAVGSNIFNIALVLGISAIITPIEVQEYSQKRVGIFNVGNFGCRATTLGSSTRYVRRHYIASSTNPVSSLHL